MIDKEAYILRITQANPVDLVVINFELVLEFLGEALEAKENDIFRAAVQKAKNGLEQLIQSLNFEIPISLDFYEIYNYSYKLLCDVQFSRDGEAACAAVKEVYELMEILLEGWRDTAEKRVAEDAPPGDAPGAIPKVYAGLTYGRDGQANEYIDENKDRGYMA
ncbi:MAG: flagellar protein FliS [Defluviitaleaceae bacterium]|nr:flagellar protein FliS [Defluviitaleaceae bacterium]